MADSSEKMSYHAGEAKGQAKEKAAGVMDQVSSTTQSTKDSIQGAGQQMMDKTHEAADAVKNATGMNK